MLSSSINLPPTLNISIYSYNIFDLYAVSKPFSTISGRLTSVRFFSCMFSVSRYNHHFKGKDKSETNSPHLHSEKHHDYAFRIKSAQSQLLTKGATYNTYAKACKTENKEKGILLSSLLWY